MRPRRRLRTLAEAVDRWPGSPEYQMAEDGEWWIATPQAYQIAIVLPCEVCGLRWCVV